MRNFPKPDFDYLLEIFQEIYELDYFVLAFDFNGTLLEDESYQKSHITQLSHAEYLDKIASIHPHIEKLYADIFKYARINSKFLSVEIRNYGMDTTCFETKKLIKIVNNFKEVNSKLFYITNDYGIDYEDLKYVVELELKKNLANKLIQ